MARVDWKLELCRRCAHRAEVSSSGGKSKRRGVMVLVVASVVQSGHEEKVRGGRGEVGMSVEC